MEIDKDYLEHHGILGMKWGVRRYQNKDGSLTAAGRRRVAKLEKEYKKVTGKDPDKISSSGSSKQRKTLAEMNDEELRSKLNRLQMEKNYLDLSKQIAALNPSTVSKGKKMINSIGSKVVGPALVDSGKNLLTKFLNKQGAKLLGLDENNQDSLKKLREEVQGMNLKKQKIELGKYFENLNKESEKSSGENRSNQTSNESKIFTGDIFGKGDSKRDTNDRQSSGNYNSGTFFTTTYRDLSNEPYSSDEIKRYSRLGSSRVSGLLGSKKK